MAGASQLKAGDRRRSSAVLAVLSLVAAALAVVSPVTPKAHADVAAKGGDFVSVSPRQGMLDTRNGVGAPKAKLTAAQTISVQAAGVASPPPPAPTPR